VVVVFAPAFVSVTMAVQIVVWFTRADDGLHVIAVEVVRLVSVNVPTWSNEAAKIAVPCRRR
jgi:hypothetical protein